MIGKNSSTKQNVEVPNHGEMEKFLVDFVNAELPGENPTGIIKSVEKMTFEEYCAWRDKGGDVPGGSLAELNRSVADLKAKTYRYWPDLWNWISDEPDRALTSIAKIRWYMRQIWEARGDERKRNWYIHRIREYHHVHNNHPSTRGALDRDDDPVLQALTWRIKGFLDELNTAKTPQEAIDKSSWVNTSVQSLLDHPPSETPFEKCVRRLQDLGNRLLKCQNPSCAQPYCILPPKSNNSKFCPYGCTGSGQKATNLNYYHNKGRQRRQQRMAKAKRRVK